MPRRPNPPDPDGPEPEHTVEVTIDGKSVDEYLEHCDNLFDEIEAVRAKHRKPRLPQPGAILQVDAVPAFAAVRVTKLGSFNTIGGDT